VAPSPKPPIFTLLDHLPQCRCTPANRVTTPALNYNYKYNENLPYDRQRKFVVLHLEYLSDRATTWLLRIQRAAVTAALGLLLWEIWLKATKDEGALLRNDELVIVNLVISSACLAVLLVVAAFFFGGVWRTKVKGLRWVHHRKRVVIHYGAGLVVQMINLIFFLVPNAVTYGNDRCGWYLLPVHVSGAIRWTCWNTVRSRD
jgi:hypothetical protein